MAVADWITSFKALFPEFSPILNESGEDVTDDTISTYLDLTMDMLPQASICYMTRKTEMNLLYWATAHLLSYMNIKDGYGEAKTLTKNASSMSAQGLSVSFEAYARLKGDMFPSLIDFFNSTAYGVMANIWLEKMSGSVGGFVV